MVSSSADNRCRHSRQNARCVLRHAACVPSDVSCWNEIQRNPRGSERFSVSSTSNKGGSLMRMRILPLAALAAAFTLPAVAAPSSSSQSSPAPGASTQSNTPNQTPKIAAKLSQSLTQAGFSDVHVMPEIVPRASQGSGWQSCYDGNQSKLNDRGHGDGPLVERRRNLEWEPFQRWCDIGFTKFHHAPVESAAAERAGSVPSALRGAGWPAVTARRRRGTR